MRKLDNDPKPDPKERGSMRVKVLGDNCVPEYILASAGNIPSPNADDGCYYPLGVVVSSFCQLVSIRQSLKLYEYG